MRQDAMNGYLIVAPPSDHYRGPDRLPWDPIDSAYWRGDLPPDLQQAFRVMRARCGLWWPVASDLACVEGMRRFAEQHHQPAGEVEILGIFSPYLTRLGMAPWSDEAFERVGYDVVSIGEWSLVQGLVQSPAPAARALSPRLNRFGLLDRPDDAGFVASLYRVVVAEGGVEALADPTNHPGVETVAVFLQRERALHRSR